MHDSNQVVGKGWSLASSIAVGVATVIMGATLAWGIVGGDLSSEGSAMMRMHWGVVTLVEIYVGMILFGCWVFWREANVVRSSIWMVVIALVGNLMCCMYVLLALRAARGNVMQFWMGNRVRCERETK